MLMFIGTIRGNNNKYICKENCHESEKGFCYNAVPRCFFEVYEMLKIKFSERFEFSNAGDEANQQNILKDIIQPIYEADVIIADLTGLNPNVMYELGLAHSFNKKTIVITRDDLSTLPFDLKQYRAKDYDTHFKKFAELLDYLETNLIGAVENTVSYSNPVKDFLTLEKIEDVQWFSDKPSIVLEDDSDKGFLDFLADIESNALALTDTINNMNDSMNKMSAGVASSTAEIERVNKNGGSGTAAFVRKESKKAAKFIDSFSSELRKNNTSMSDLWDEIEKNTLGLLENRFASNDNNKTHLIEYLKSLYKMKNSITESNSSIEGLKSSMETVIGMECSMNQAIRFVIADLSSYLLITGRLKASIEKILAKRRFIVGDIEYSNVNCTPSSRQ